MELLLIVTLLASNIFLICKFLKKTDSKTESPESVAPQLPREETKEEVMSQKTEDDNLISKSIVDLTRINSLIESKVKARLANMVDEMVERTVQELTKPEDVGLPPEPLVKPTIPPVPQDELDEVFTHKTVSESFGEETELRERETGGYDFKAIESAVRVAKDEPHTEEEAKAAKETLSDIQGTVIADRIALDPKVRTRILSIIYGDSDESLTEETISKKKVVFSGTIDTFDVDQLNLNILT